MGFWEIINDRKRSMDLSMQFYQNVSFNSASIRREKITRFLFCYVSFDIAINQIKLIKYERGEGKTSEREESSCLVRRCNHEKSRILMKQCERHSSKFFRLQASSTFGDTSREWELTFQFAAIKRDLWNFSTLPLPSLPPSLPLSLSLSLALFLSLYDGKHFILIPRQT